MEVISARIRIKNNNGVSIFVTENKKSFYDFGLKVDKEFKDRTAIKEGTVLKVEGEKYIVTKIVTTYYLGEPTEEFPFNLDIYYYVDRLIE